MSSILAEGYPNRLEDYRQSTKDTKDKHTFVQRALEGNIQVNMHRNFVLIDKNTYSSICGYI
jgi:hypothetical protein